MELESSLRSKGVKYVMLSFVDMHGIPKAKMVPLDHLHSCSRGSELFTGAKVDGVPQAVGRRGARSATRRPWRCSRTGRTCYVPASLYLRGEPFEPCSRNIYSRVAERAKAMGYLYKLGIEAEFFVLRDSDDVSVMRSQQPYCGLEDLHKPCYDAARLVDNLPWLTELVEAMDELGWGVYSFDHEDAVGQFEIDFAFCEAGELADRFVLLRMMACAIARKHGCYATWMPKPMEGRTGSGAHLNVSLHDFETEANPRRDDGGEGLSPLGAHFLGVMAHLDAICAVACPTVNRTSGCAGRRRAPPRPRSAERLLVGPRPASHGSNNRTNAVRVPASGRFEIRASDSAVNPHLAAALVLAAGLGAEQRLDPPPRAATTTCTTSRRRRAAAARPRRGARRLRGGRPRPARLRADMHAAWCDFKRAEWQDYCSSVSQWEVKCYLRQFG